MRIDSTQPLKSTNNNILFGNTYFFQSYSFVQNQHGVKTVNPLRSMSTANANLTSVEGGCFQIKDEAECLASKDGRSDFKDQPCRWCCGYECTSQGNSLCEPENWLLKQPSYVKFRSINGLGDGFCRRPSFIYDGKSTSFGGKCRDAFGNEFGYVSKEMNLSDCDDFCQSLPNYEFQVGYYFKKSSKACHCCYEQGTLPEHSDLNEQEISAYISPNLPGIGSISLGDGDLDYECHLTLSDQEKSARTAMEMCDTTMSLFVGNDMSVGRLREIASELEENGSSYMPGECCLDTAATSARFGFNVST